MESECGDGFLDRATESCDDGNIANGDGCSSDCKIESLFVCPDNKCVQIMKIHEIPAVFTDIGIIHTTVTTKAGQLHIVAESETRP